MQNEIMRGMAQHSILTNGKLLLNKLGLMEFSQSQFKPQRNNMISLSRLIF